VSRRWQWRPSRQRTGRPSGVSFRPGPTLRAIKEVDGAVEHTILISTPLLAKSLAAGLESSRVMPRRVNSLERIGSARTALMTEPPWLPVAPKTVSSLDMVLNVSRVDWGKKTWFLFFNEARCLTTKNDVKMQRLEMIFHCRTHGLPITILISNQPYMYDMGVLKNYR
jgi:hypothetical protein